MFIVQKQGGDSPRISLFMSVCWSSVFVAKNFSCSNFGSFAMQMTGGILVKGKPLRAGFSNR